MANHQKPTITSNYIDFVSELDGRFNDILLGLDPASTAATNLVSGSIRWNSQQNRWEKVTVIGGVSDWQPLSTAYNINITGSAGSVTNGVYTTGSYSDPSWITQLSGTKIQGNVNTTVGGIVPTNTYAYATNIAPPSTSTDTSHTVLVIRETGSANKSNTTGLSTTLNSATEVSLISIVRGTAATRTGDTLLRALFNTINPQTGLRYGDISGNGSIDLTDAIQLIKYINNLSIPADQLTRIHQLIAFINQSPDRFAIAQDGYINLGVGLNQQSLAVIQRAVAGTAESNPGGQALRTLLTTTNPLTNFPYGDITQTNTIDAGDVTAIEQFLANTLTNETHRQRIFQLINGISASADKELMAAYGVINSDGANNIVIRGTNGITVTAENPRSILITGPGTSNSFSSITKTGISGTGNIGQTDNKFGTLFVTTVSADEITKTGTNNSGNIGQSNNKFANVYATNFVGNADTVTNGVYTNATYTDPTWLTLTADKVGLGTGSNPQFNSLGVGTAGSGTAGEIRATNNVTAFYSSDAKFKENIRDIPNATEIVLAIGGKLYDWTDEYIKQHGGEDGYFVQKSDFGVIAQDVLQKFPRAVRTRPDGSLAVDYEKLNALAFAAIKEQEARIKLLEQIVLSNKTN